MTHIALTTLFLATLLLSMNTIASNATYYSVDQYLLIVHEDGSIDVYINITVPNPPADISIPVIGTPIFYEAYTNDIELPITYGNDLLTVTVYYDNATIHYVTVETTSKTGDLWTLAFNTHWTCIVVLPDNAVIVNIEPTEFTPTIVDERLGLMFSPGQVNITYILMPIITKTTTTATTGTTTQPILTTTTTKTSTDTTQTKETTTPSPQPQHNTILLITLGIIAIAIIAYTLIALARKKIRGNSGSAEINYSRLDERDKAILRALKEHGELTGRELMEKTGIPKTPFYRKLKKLIDMGLIEYRDVEGIRRYRLRR